jgi:peptidoglycan/LPS O-acetylase OafA/YrhL
VLAVQPDKDGTAVVRRAYREDIDWLRAIAVLAVVAIVSFALSIWLMGTDRSANAFFMSPPRAWEFLIGGLVAIDGFPALGSTLAQQIVRGIALLLIAILIFSLRQGPGFPGFNALLPCIGAAMFIWSGIGVPTLTRGHLHFCGRRGLSGAAMPAHDRGWHSPWRGITRISPRRGRRM